MNNRPGIFPGAAGTGLLCGALLLLSSIDPAPPGRLPPAQMPVGRAPQRVTASLQIRRFKARWFYLLSTRSFCPVVLSYHRHL